MEGPGDNPAYAQHIAGNTAIFIKLFHWNDLFVSGDLADTVCRGIQDQISGPDVELSVISKYLRTRIWEVAEDPPAGAARKFTAELHREASGISGKGSFR